MLTLSDPTLLREAAFIDGAWIGAGLPALEVTNPATGEVQARLALASALASKGSYRDALEGLLEVVRRDRGAYRDQARRSMLSMFALLGDDHELTQEYRPQLAMLLF